MCRLFKSLVIMLVLSQASPALSVPLSAIVTVDGREWAQPVLFADTSRGELNAACPGGTCSGLAGGVDLTGWHWADVEAISELFNFYIGETVFVSGVPTVYFSMTNLFGLRFYEDGWLRTPGVPGDALGPIAAGKLFSSSGRVAYMGHTDVFPASEASIGRTDQTFGFNVGAWLYRERALSVPSPSSIALISGGLCLLTLRKRKRGRFNFS